MARRSDHTKEQLKQLAIDEGISLLQAEGIQNFSARKVAARMGYTVGTIYHIFGTYDDFIMQINAATLDRWYKKMQETLAKSRSTDPVRVLAQFYIRYARENYNEWVSLFEYHPQNKEAPLPDWYNAKLARFFETLESLLEAQLGSNRRKLKRSARILWAGIHGITILALSGKLDLVGSEQAETLAHSFVSSYLQGAAQTDA